MTSPRRRHASSFPRALRRMEAVISREAIPELMRRVTALELSVAQVGTLFHLMTHGRCSVSDLAAAVGLSMPATSALLERLVQRELVVREEDPENRRQKRIALTRQGQALVGQLEDAREAAFLRMFGKLPPELLERLERVMTEVADALPGEQEDAP